jgi:hypothetical protein
MNPFINYYPHNRSHKGFISPEDEEAFAMGSAVVAADKSSRTTTDTLPNNNTQQTFRIIEESSSEGQQQRCQGVDATRKRRRVDELPDLVDKATQTVEDLCANLGRLCAHIGTSERDRAAERWLSSSN